MEKKLPAVLSAQQSQNMFRRFELFVPENRSIKSVLEKMIPELSHYSAYKVEILMGRLGVYDVNLNYMKWKPKSKTDRSRPSFNLSMKVYVPGKQRSGHMETGDYSLRAFSNGRGDFFLNYRPFAPEMIMQQAFEEFQKSAVRFIQKLMDKAVQDGTDGFIAEANARLHEKRAEQCRTYKDAAVDAVLIEDVEDD